MILTVKTMGNEYYKERHKREHWHQTLKVHIRQMTAIFRGQSIRWLLVHHGIKVYVTS